MIVKTIIADRENILLDGLELLLTSGEQYFYRIVGRANSVEQLEDLIVKCPCDLLITEINLGDSFSTEFIKKIKKKLPQLHVCVLSSYENDKFVRKAFIDGTQAYVSKKQSFKNLLKAIATISNGRTYLSPGLRMTPSLNKESQEDSKHVHAMINHYQIVERLTKREMEILRLIADAKNNIEIGKLLFISDQTVGVHRKNIMRKLNISSTASLIKFAFENGLT